MGIRQPVKLAIVSPVKAANISLRIAPFLPEMPRRNPCDSSACLPTLQFARTRASAGRPILDVPNGLWMGNRAVGSRKIRLWLHLGEESTDFLYVRRDQVLSEISFADASATRLGGVCGKTVILMGRQAGALDFDLSDLLNR
jgi:hypothetical protein